ncbi:MAG: signal peptidase II [Rhodospirillales bacterium]|nr:signal peptidase II [Rhodospirillales bacterium]
MRKGLGLAVLAFGLDQATKWWIVERVMQPPRFIEITPFFNLVMGWNRGISFGLFNNDSPYNAWVLTTIAAVIVVVLLVWLRRAERGVIAAGIGLVIGGAIGNAVDRMRFGAVADFLDFHVAGFHWPAFNVADSAIFIGAALLVFDALFGQPEKHKN